MINAGWCETYGEFSEWLEEAGVTMEGLPAWPGRAPVRVVAAQERLYLERVPRREYRQFQRMTARGDVRLRALPMARLAQMHSVTVTAVDEAKLKAWSVNNERCN